MSDQWSITRDHRRPETTGDQRPPATSGHWLAPVVGTYRYVRLQNVREECVTASVANGASIPLLISYLHIYPPLPLPLSPSLSRRMRTF